MHPHATATALLLGALPAVAAGFLVLSLCGVPRAVGALQAAALAAMVLLALGGGRLLRAVGPAWRRLPDALWAGAALLLITLPLWGSGPGPHRWLRLGPLALYVAPVVLPLLLVWAARRMRGSPAGARGASAWLAVAALGLAAQPDLSQVLALSAAAAVLIVPAHAAQPVRAALWLAPFLAACAWAALQPDPLQPVPHVEQVFAVAWRHAPWAGAAVTASALLLLATQARLLAARDGRLAVAVPLYYGVLFMASWAERTPAPLIGFGAGPLLGYGLLVAALSRR